MPKWHKHIPTRVFEELHPAFCWYHPNVNPLFHGVGQTLSTCVGFEAVAKKWHVMKWQ